MLLAAGFVANAAINTFIQFANAHNPISIAIGPAFQPADTVVCVDAVSTTPGAHLSGNIRLQRKL
jgi:hypothetical protein